ncbi:major histocompatibility complex class I-related gene protein-like [Amblyraja radiata]|uniref:major histocompatibility complex class I-related gene protein-like n=1 Tax=Amblyraja radiata TaxID=386614 RepID=UPI001401EA76|nr:major histocompatibility complex class I-related gene protein-like [Amblyraja radiata]
MESYNVPVSVLFAVLSLCSVSGDHAESHSLIYFATYSLSIPDLPDFARVGMLDDLQIDYYDNSLEEVVPRQQWIANGFTADYWTQQKKIADFIHTIVSKQLGSFGHLLGITYFQGIWGCTQSENMIHLFVKFSIQDLGGIDCDLVTVNCSATGILKILNDPSNLQIFFNNAAVEAVNNSCIPDLQKALQLGEAALERRVVPGVTVLKRDKGEGLRCVITPFYPRTINATWLRNGQAVSNGINKILLPNHDDTYRMELLIELHGQDPKMYCCQVQHSSLPETLTMTLTGGVGGPHDAFGASYMLVLMATLVMIVGTL